MITKLIEFDKSDSPWTCYLCENVVPANTKYIMFDGTLICRTCIKRLATFINDHRTELLSL